MSKQTAISGHEAGVTPITATSLRSWPLPALNEQGDKNDRGSLLIIGGSRETPGAVILAATAALRSGVGRLRIATCEGLAPLIGVAVPEARVFSLPETPAGTISPAAANQLTGLAHHVHAVLIGPGMIGDDTIHALLELLVPQIEPAALVLDAGALNAHTRDLHVANPRNLIMTPHAGEMAQLSGSDKDAITADPKSVALCSAADFGSVIVLKGATTWIANADAEVYCYQEGHVGLAASGSGDTLSGAIAGLAARAASPIQAAAWGVYLHGESGNRLARRFGPVGFLAREIPDELPGILAELE